MKNIAVIPARYDSSRFKGKPLYKILDKPMIQWVYEQVKNSNLFDKVIVATDDMRIYDAVTAFNGEVRITSQSHSSGTDRVFEVANNLGLDNDDVVFNIQGDEPLVNKTILSELLSAFDDKEVEVATLKKRLTLSQDINNPDIAKVVTNKDDNAMLFSRSTIPFNRSDSKCNYYKHIGLYAYKYCVLEKFTTLEKSELEFFEKLEQLRFLENGVPIKVIETNQELIGVDRLEHINKVEKILRERNE